MFNYNESYEEWPYFRPKSYIGLDSHRLIGQLLDCSKRPWPYCKRAYGHTSILNNVVLQTTNLCMLLD